MSLIDLLTSFPLFMIVLATIFYVVYKIDKPKK